jgi:hypothetical protein
LPVAPAGYFNSIAGLQVNLCSQNVFIHFLILSMKYKKTDYLLNDSLCFASKM